MDTGSSASSTVGLAASARAKRDPLALAAGQLVRVLRHELRRRGQPDLLEQRR